SNHFRTADLKSLSGWDPFNVTEDCDLGVRIFKEGYNTIIIDSVTLEEANSDVKNWIRQRSRWIKGYLQTYLVHMREPISLLKKQGRHAFIFQLIIGMRIIFILINPFLWLATIAYFTLYKYVGPTIESLYPSWVFYMAATSLIFGNFIYIYNYMIGSAKRAHWSIIKYVFLIPFYWVFMSIAAFMAFYQLIFKPHHWEKTHHGLHLAQNKNRLSFRKKIKIIDSVPSWISDIYEKQNVKDFLRSGLAGGSVLVFAGIASNFLSYIYNAYLSRRLNIEDFGVISLFGSFVFLSSIPLSALTSSITHKAAYFFGKQKRPIYGFWREIRSKVFVISSVITVMWLLATPLLKIYFNNDSILPFLIFTPVLLINSLIAVDIGYLSGNLKFYILAALLIIENLIKLGVTIVLVEVGLKDYIYVAIPVSLLVSFTIGYLFASQIRDTSEAAIEEEQSEKFPYKFFASSFLSRFSIVAYISFDIILASHFLSQNEAGKYALISLVGKMIFFVGTLFAQFIIPIISRDQGAENTNSKSFIKLFLLSAASSIAVYIVVGPLGWFTTPLLFGSKIASVAYLLPVYGLGMVCFSMATSIISYHQARDKYTFSAMSFVLAIIQVIVFALYHNNLQSVIYVMTIIGALNLVSALFLHFYGDYFETFTDNINDFLGAFKSVPQKKSLNPNNLNFLIFNWRDTKHVWAGGAEVYIHEIAKKLVEDGHRVTLFCGNDHKCKRYEEIDGVQIVRRGGFYTVYLWAFLYYITQFRNKFDIVIDAENGIPFFTPLYVRKPIIGLIFHVHQGIILKELNLSLLQLPMGIVAKILESKIMPLVYANVKMLTISESTKRDMKEFGFDKKYSIEIINPGIEPFKFFASEKTSYPSITYVGRLKAYKRVDVLISALPEILKDSPDTKLRIAGFGETREDLEKLAKKLDVASSVEFLGRISEEEKTKLLGESWVFAYPSSMEGWGISIIEANACGTPVVASEVPGLIDSVVHDSTGYLVKLGDVEAFARTINMLLFSESRRKELGQNGISWASNFTWRKSTDKLIKSVH
ncbi:MAG TPA: glycosyltransferase, partial [Candidatus Saccharimonadales bacterium]|nr:glycosyltransferase [Candidatus Saccharimonadales bacterium]